MLKRASNLVSQLIAERQAPASLQAQQLERLRLLVSEAYAQTESYRCLLQRAGVKPDDVRTFDDLRRLPVVTKRELLEFSESERTNRQHQEHGDTFRIATSGSSGNPFEFLVDRRGNDWRKAQYLRPYVSNGRRPWHRVLRLTAVGTDAGAADARLSVFRERRMACTAPLDRQLAELAALQPSIVQGYPSALRCLAFEMLRQGALATSVRTVFSDSELLTPDTRALVERAFRAPVIDVFGSYETDNIAYQCAQTDAYHVAMDSAIVEVCRDGEPAGTSAGDLVVTVLRNLTTPFIRYNLEDVVRWRTEPCPCGRTFPLLDIVAGRRDDLVATATGQWQSPLSFLWRFDAFADFVREYQIVQTAVDRFVVRIVAQTSLDEAANRAIREAITADFPNAAVTVREVARLERTQAEKLKAFVSHVRRQPADTHGN